MARKKSLRPRKLTGTSLDFAKQVIEILYREGIGGLERQKKKLVLCAHHQEIYNEILEAVTKDAPRRI